MSKPYLHIIHLRRGDRLNWTWRGEVDGVDYDWSGVSISCRLVNTADDTQVEVITPTVGTIEDGAVVSAVFNVADTSAYPTGKLRGDVEVSGTDLGTFTPIEVLIYCEEDTTT